MNETKLHTIEDLKRECQSYVNEVGLCVTVTETTYIYTHGREAGAIIGLINYPRFPANPDQIRRTALELAGRLLENFNQQKVSVVFPGETIMLQPNEVRQGLSQYIGMNINEAKAKASQLAMDVVVVAEKHPVPLMNDYQAQRITFFIDSDGMVKTYQIG